MNEPMNAYFRDQLDAIIEKAPALRKAGVAAVQTSDGIAFDLLPEMDFDVTAVKGSGRDERAVLPAELDPATYSGRGVPGYPKPPGAVEFDVEWGKE